MGRTKILCFILTMMVCLSMPLMVYAEEKNWEIRNYQTIRIDTQQEEDHAYLTRTEISISHRFSEEWDIKFGLQPFAEARYNWDVKKWKRKETGVEAGFHLGQCAYIGESLHYAWLKNNDDTLDLKQDLK